MRPHWLFWFPLSHPVAWRSLPGRPQRPRSGARISKASRSQGNHDRRSGFLCSPIEAWRALIFSLATQAKLAKNTGNFLPSGRMPIMTYPPSKKPKNSLQNFSERGPQENAIGRTLCGNSLGRIVRFSDKWVIGSQPLRVARGSHAGVPIREWLKTIYKIQRDLCD